MNKNINKIKYGFCLIAILVSNSIFARYDKFYTGFKSGYTKISNLSDSQTQKMFGLDVTMKPTVKFKHGFNAELYFGKYFNRFRLETAINYIRENVDSVKVTAKSNGSVLYEDNNNDGHLASTSIMLNGYYDFHLTQFFYPYLGIGLGANIAKFKSVKSKNSSEDVKGKIIPVMAFQGMLGIDYNFTRKFIIILEYRFLLTTNFDYIKKGVFPGYNEFKDNIIANSINIGLKFIIG